mgnify:CR=1 FL=1
MYLREGSIQVDADVVLERNGQTVETIEMEMKNDVTEVVNMTVTGGPQGGFAFNPTYVVVESPEPITPIVTTPMPTAAAPTTMAPATTQIPGTGSLQYLMAEVYIDIYGFNNSTLASCSRSICLPNIPSA